LFKLVVIMTKELKIFVAILFLLIYISASSISALKGQWLNATGETVHYINHLPYNITKPGIYILTADITISSDKNATIIKTSNVIIDGDNHKIMGTGNGGGIGIVAVNLSNITIKNTEISGNFNEGMVLTNISDSNIYNNIVNDKYSGMIFYSSSNDKIYNNTISDNQIGIVMYSSSYNTIYNNKMSNSSGIILYADSDNNTIYGNVISNSHDGIGLIASSNNTIYANLFIDNKYGAGLLASSNNTIYHNNFINNSIQAIAVNSINVWDNGYPSGGNYWSDYKGTDSNGDGIGDIPYIINNSKNNIDYYPLMKPYIIKTRTTTTLPPTTTNPVTSTQTQSRSSTTTTGGETTSTPISTISKTITTHSTTTVTTRSNTSTTASITTSPSKNTNKTYTLIIVGVIIAIAIGVAITLLRKH